MVRSALTWLLGIEHGEIAEGTGVRLKMTSPWPAWGILLFGVAAVWLVFFLYSREKGTASKRAKRALAAVRCLIIALVVFVLFRPILTVEKSQLQQAYVIVLVDESLSMGATERYKRGDGADVPLALAQVAGLVDESAQSLSPGNEQELGKLTRAGLVNRVLANQEIGLLGDLAGLCKLRVCTFAGDVERLAPEDWRPSEGAPVPLLSDPECRRGGQDSSGDGDRFRARERRQKTLLGAALREVAERHRGHRIAAVIVLSDGRTQDVGPTAVETAGRLGAIHDEPFPVFTIGVGAREERTDIEVVDVLAPTAARKDDKVTFTILVGAVGKLPDDGLEVDVRLTCTKIEAQGKRPAEADGEGKQVDVRRVRLRAGPRKKVAIDYTPKSVGEFRFTASVPVQPEEEDASNNRAEHILTVKDAKAKVLFVAGQPSYFYRYLKNALIVDRSIDLRCLLQSADADFEQDGNIGGFPESRKELYENDVVVFSDVDPAMFRPEQLSDLRAFVREFGGGFILVAGPANAVEQWRGTPVAELLPVQLSQRAASRDLLTDDALTVAFQPAVTREGRDHGIMRLAERPDESQAAWRSFPGCYWYHPVDDTKTGTVVLVEHPHERARRGHMPLIAVSQPLRGRTLFCALDGTWRWRFGVGDLYFNRFWVQAINFVGSYRILGGGRHLRLVGHKRAYAFGERVTVQAQCLDDSFRPAKAKAVEARVEMPGSETRLVWLTPSADSPSIFEGSFEADRVGTRGLITVSFAGETVSRPFMVAEPDTESTQGGMDEATLKKIARATSGGEFLRLHEIRGLRDKIGTAAERITRPISDEIYDAPLVVILFLALICTEWWFRKRRMLA